MEAVGDRYNAPLEYLQPTAAGIDGLPAWFLRLAAPILQNDRLSDQLVVCYICTRSAPAARLRPGAESSLPGAAASLH